MSLGREEAEKQWGGGENGRLRRIALELGAANRFNQVSFPLSIPEDGRLVL